MSTGCQSELEIRGLRDVLAVTGLPAPLLQHRVDLPDGPVHLDAAWPELKIAVEFDGAAFHGRLSDRERDLRRDAALAALGWVVLRFGFRDVTERPHVCRARIVAVHQQRSVCPWSAHYRHRTAHPRDLAPGVSDVRWPSSRAIPSRRLIRSGIGGCVENSVARP